MGIKQPQTLSLQYLPPLFRAEKSGFTLPMPPVQYFVHPQTKRRNSHRQTRKRKIMKIFSQTILCTTVCLLFAGCCFLPAGDPPDGNIVDNNTSGKQQLKTAAEVRDYFISTLTVALLENCPGQKINLNTDANTNDITRYILCESSRITGNTITSPETDWSLNSTFANGEFVMTLSNKTTTVWQEKLPLSWE
jgi:hypothetical protein